jgi:uncharacterized repeat protein (TIGR01451 family)
MRNLFTKLRQAPKHIFAIVAVVAAVITVPAALLAWGPDRKTFTIDNPADHVTFNSITNNPNIGDERNFVGIREVGSNNTWYDTMDVKEGKEYFVRLYVHNNAATSLNASGEGIAKDVKAIVNLPTNTAKSIQVNGFINSSNATPREVYDHATFTSNKDFNLSYVSNSLKYENNAGTFNLPESIFTSNGAKLGYDKMDGSIPGCFGFSGYVTFKVKPQIAKTTDFTLQKKVSKHGAAQWVENYDAKPGETVDFLLAYKNTGEVQHNNVTFRDTLPKGLTYVPNSTTWSNASNKNVKTSDNIISTGINVGAYAPGANAFTVFSAKVAEAKDLECGTNKLINKGKVNADEYSLEDDATVTVPKECQPEVKKIKVCDLTTKQVITIDEKDFNSSKHSKDLAGCKETPGTINVCELSTKKIVTIKESDFDASKYSKNLNDCKETPITPEVPTELPETGVADAIAKIAGAISLTSATAYYLASRRI